MRKQAPGHCHHRYIPHTVAGPASRTPWSHGARLCWISTPALQEADLATSAVLGHSTAATVQPGLLVSRRQVGR